MFDIITIWSGKSQGIIPVRAGWVVVGKICHGSNVAEVRYQTAHAIVTNSNQLIPPHLRNATVGEQDLITDQSRAYNINSVLSETSYILRPLRTFCPLSFVHACWALLI